MHLQARSTGMELPFPMQHYQLSNLELEVIVELILRIGGQRCRRVVELLIQKLFELSCWGFSRFDLKARLSLGNEMEKRHVGSYNKAE